MKHSNRGLIKLFLALTLLLGAQLLLAQDAMDEMEEGQNEVKCKPSDLSSPYDKYASDSVTVRQIQIWYSFGSEEFKHKQYKRVIPYFWKVLENDETGTYKVVYSKLATAYFELGKSAEGNSSVYLDSTLLVLYRGLEKFPDYARLHFTAGSIQRSLGRAKCAIPHYEALVKANPKQKSYVQILAQLLFQVEDERCIEVQQQVIDLDPEDQQARELLVTMIKYFGGDPIEAMRKSFENDTTNITNALKYGKEALVTGEYKQALRAFKAVLVQDPSHIEAREQLAKSYEGLNRISAAIREYKAILKIDPKNVRVLCDLARAYSSLNNFKVAANYANQASRIDPQNGQPYMVMAEIYIAAVDYCSSKRKEREYTYDDKLVFEKAGKWYRKAERDPNYASAASTRRKGLKPLYRTTEDKFLYNRETIKDACYSWIK